MVIKGRVGGPVEPEDQLAPTRQCAPNLSPRNEILDVKRLACCIRLITRGMTGLPWK
jgi:hypothetical protein